MRSRMRAGGGTSVMRRASACWISTAQHTADKRARELGERPAGLEPEDAAAVHRDRRVDHLVVAQLERGLGPGAVVGEQALMVGHFGDQDRCQLFLDVDAHALAPPAVSASIVQLRWTRQAPTAVVREEKLQPRRLLQLWAPSRSTGEGQDFTHTDVARCELS